MHYFIVRKSDSTYYCAAFTLSGFCTDWMDSAFYDSEAAAQTIADGLKSHYNESFEVAKC